MPDIETGTNQAPYTFTPEIIKFGDREDYVIGKVVTDYYNTVQSAYWQKKRAERDEHHKIYMGYMDPASYPWEGASNCDLGIVEMCTDNIKSRYKLSTIGAKPMFNSIPLTSDGERDKEKVTDSMNYVLENDIEIEKKLESIAQNTVEYGTCPVKIYWKKDYIEQTEYRAIGDVSVPYDKSEVLEKGEADIIDLEDFIVPEGCPEDISKAPWVMHRVWMSINDLEKKVKLGFYSQDAVDKVKVAIQREKEQACKTPEEKLQVILKLPEEKVEILEVYKRVLIKESDKIERECILWVCPKSSTLLKAFLLKDIYFKGKRPFYVYRYKSTGTFYGRGVPEIVKPYRKLMNDVFNFAVNCMVLQILPWGFYRIGSSFRPEEVRLAPGVMIPVDDVNDVKIAQFPVSAQIAEGFVKLLMQFVERQTGISSPQMGKEFPTRKTATEVKTIISEGNVKHEDRIQVFQDNFSDMLKGIYNLYRQNQPKGREGRILEGEDYRFVKLFSAFDRLPDFDFMVMGSLTTGNKVIEREDTMALYSIAANNPIIAEYPNGQLELLKEVFGSFGKKNLKRFLPPDQLVNILTQAKMQQVAGMAAQMMMGKAPMHEGQTPEQTPEMPSPEGASQPGTGLPLNGNVGSGGPPEGAM